MHTIQTTGHGSGAEVRERRVLVRRTTLYNVHPQKSPHGACGLAGHGAHRHATRLIPGPSCAAESRAHAPESCDVILPLPALAIALDPGSNLPPGAHGRKGKAECGKAEAPTASSQSRLPRSLPPHLIEELVRTGRSRRSRAPASWRWPRSTRWFWPTPTMRTIAISTRSASRSSGPGSIGRPRGSTMALRVASLRASLRRRRGSGMPRRRQNGLRDRGVKAAGGNGLK